MNIRQAIGLTLIAVVVGCSDGGNDLQPLVPTTIASAGGDGQSAGLSSSLADSLRVRVSDASGADAPGITVTWSVLTGGGVVSPVTATTDAAGIASAEFTLGAIAGEQRAQAAVSGLSGSPIVFTAVATSTPPPPPPPPPPPLEVNFSVAGGGNNVPERFTSDLWVHGGYAYTGTWGTQGNRVGNVLKVWALDASGAPVLRDSVKVAQVGTISDVEVSSDGEVLLLGAEQGSRSGVYLYSLANPATPTFLDSSLVSSGIHTATFGEIGGRRYAFAARNPGGAALLIYDVTVPSDMVLTATVPVPENYGIHDTFVRDGLAFVFAWDSGVIIYDVGNGIRGGSPSAPVEVSRLVTSDGDTGSPAVHNGWWFHNPVTSERRYLFIGQEGPAIIGAEASGDIHVVDVSDLAHPREVAFLHREGAGAHNFWMDESRQILYAAYYNDGVVALDVSGTLSGDLSNRLLDQLQPGGPGNTFTWGVQLFNGSLYASDMVSGLWQLAIE